MGAHILVFLSVSSMYIPFIVTVINGLSYNIFCTAIEVTVAILIDDHHLSTAWHHVLLTLAMLCLIQVLVYLLIEVVTLF